MLHPGSDCSSGRSRNRSRSSDRSSNGTLHTHLLTPFSTTLGSAPTSPGAHVTPSVAIINALLAEEEHHTHAAAVSGGGGGSGGDCGMRTRTEEG